MECKIMVYEHIEDDQDWVCGECGEYRPDDARVESGMKCGHCAYIYGEGDRAEYDYR